jgi:hypothetical protein
VCVCVCVFECFIIIVVIEAMRVREISRKRPRVIYPIVCVRRIHLNTPSRARARSHNTYYENLYIIYTYECRYSDF